MRYIWLFFAILSFVWYGLASYVPDQVLVQYRPSGFSLFSAESVSPSLQLVELEGESVQDAIARLSQDPDVLHVQPNFVYTLWSFPNDSFFWQQRYLRNVGQTMNYIGWVSGTIGADINWLSGMALFSGVNNPTLWQNIIAVIDDGVFYNHQDLTGQMWNGVNCLSRTGTILGSCIHGYDFLLDTWLVLPQNFDSHGTAVAGIIAAKTNNSLGIAWVNPQAGIMSLRTFSGRNSDTFLIAQAVDFARYNGAKIINASFGWTGDDLTLRTAIANFDWLFIAAAGNFWWNHNDPSRNIYPCDYSALLSNVICVAWSTHTDNLWSLSDFWLWYVQLAAPSFGIYTTTWSITGYDFVVWTSFATPIVAGMASLLWSWYPDAPMSAVRQAIFSGVDVLPSLSWLVDTSGRANLYNSLFHLFVDAQTPESFTVTGSMDVAPSTFLESDPVMISGIYTGVNVTVSTWFFRVGSWSSRWSWQWTWQTGTIWSGDQLQFALTSSLNFSTTTSMDFTVGLFSGSFDVVTVEDSPDPFAFFLLTGVEPNSLYTSNTITITWLILPVPISVSTGLYSLDNGSTWSWVWQTGLVTNGQTLQLALTSSMASLGVRSMVVTVWSYSTGFTIQTKRTAPDPFTVSSVSNAQLGSFVVSTPIVFSGFVESFDISVNTGLYSLDNGLTWSWVWQTGLIISGNSLVLALTSSVNFSTLLSMMVNIWTYSTSFHVTTQAAPSSGWWWWGWGWGWGWWWAWGWGDVWPSCTPSSVINGQINQSTCTITCNTGYSLSGQQCLDLGTGVVLGDVNQTGDLLPQDQIMQLFTLPSGGQAISPSALVVPENVTCAPALELQTAYAFAFGLGITTMPNVSQSRMCDGVIRAELAKMVANYAMQVHSLVPDQNRVCTFADITNQSFEMQYYIRLVCQLGIMGVGLTNFEPNGLVDRWQWGTVLSRILYGNQYNDADPYYLKHLNALQAASIITNTNPTLRELRGFVMLMMMRASN